MCIVVFPWGKYGYLRLPMGLCNSPNIFQEKMIEVFHNLEYVGAYIDVLLVITSISFKEHLDHLEKKIFI